MGGWQDVLQQNASRILLGLTLAVLAVLVIRYRIETARQRAATARASVVHARQDMQQLGQDLQLSGAGPEILAARRDQLTAQIMSEISESLADSGDADAAIRADAYTIRGDLNWSLGNAPVFPEAATRPSLATKDSPDALLSEAEADYRHVVEQYPNQIMDWSTAALGLAAIAEDRSNWDEARKRYEEVEKRTDAPDLVKSTAQLRMALLDRISQPILVGPYSTTAATSPTSEPITAVTPATRAATQPAK
jgi:tetratricopeptide (TPR) repeat protein